MKVCLYGFYKENATNDNDKRQTYGEIQLYKLRKIHIYINNYTESRQTEGGGAESAL